jgi:hypothetical protein
MNKPIISILATALVLVFTHISCSEKEKQDTLPELPPVDALMMDFSQFINNPAVGQMMKSAESYENALYSYTTVAVWNALVTIPMIVPVAAYLECFNHTPVYLGDNSWQWSYTWGGAETYAARLVTKRISNEEFTAEMFISKTGSYTDFKWFEGIVRYDRTHAEWTMYESPLNNVAWLSIEWNMDWEQEISDITYTIVKPGGEETGSYITFGITGDADYDAFYTISFSQKDTYIKWNRTSKVGRVKDEVNFEDADWHCWDELFQDVQCN